MSADTMHAIRVARHGGPEVLVPDTIETPRLGSGQVLVRVEAAGVNFIDVYFRSGQYGGELPYTPGKEGAGTVVATGDDVTRFAPGDRIAWAMGDGSYAEQALVDVATAVPVPQGVALDIAAAALLQGLTAHYLARSIVPLGAGDEVLVHAGAGGVGLVLTQWLAHLGVRVITTTSSPQKAELSRAAGAAVTLGYDDFTPKVREATGGRGVKAVFDGVGATTFAGSLDSLRPRGTLALFGAASGPVDPLDPQILNTKGSLVLTRPSLAHFIADREELDWRAGELFGLIADGVLDIRIGGRYDLDQARQAHEDLEARRSTGKLLLIP